MSDTPRTDTESQASHCAPAVNINFARQLERELAAMTVDRDRLKAGIVEIRAIPTKMYGDHWSHDKALDPEQVRDICDDLIEGEAAK